MSAPTQCKSRDFPWGLRTCFARMQEALATYGDACMTVDGQYLVEPMERLQQTGEDALEQFENLLSGGERVMQARVDAMKALDITGYSTNLVLEAGRIFLGRYREKATAAFQSMIRTTHETDDSVWFTDKEQVLLCVALYLSREFKQQWLLVAAEVVILPEWKENYAAAIFLAELLIGNIEDCLDSLGIGNDMLMSQLYDAVKFATLYEAKAILDAAKANAQVTE
jgi:hypothetical protein